MSRERGGAPLTVTSPRPPQRRDGTSRDAPLGGQAVIEGVMMRGLRTWAVAVRAPAAGGAIEVRTFPIGEPLARRLRRVPVVRGVLALWDSLAIAALRAVLEAERPGARDAEELLGLEVLA